MKLAIRLMVCGVWMAVALLVGSITSESQVFPDPLVVACGDETHPPDLVPEIRAAASSAAVGQVEEALLRKFNRTKHIIFEQANPVSLEQLNQFGREITEEINRLEQISQGPNTQCRTVTFTGLVQLYWMRARIRALIVGGPEVSPVMIILRGLPVTVGREYLRQIQLLADSVKRTQTFELASVRAYSTVVLSTEFLALQARSTPPQVPPTDLIQFFDPNKWERIACGGKETFSALKLEIDGSVFIQNNDSQGFPFRLWAAIYWLGATSGSGHLLDSAELLDIAINGCSSEIRGWSAINYFLSPSVDTDDEDKLRVLAREGESAELRSAAALFLAPLFAADKSLSDEDLQRLTLGSETTELRSAGGQALGMRWEEQAKQGKLGLTTVFSFLGPDGKTFQEGTLIQFAAAHAGAHP